LSSALRGDDLQGTHQAMRQAVEQIEHEIANLRAIITELRPAALDELGLGVAIEALLERHREQSGLAIDGELSLPGSSPDEERLDSDLETTVYRMVQEALTNVVKHAGAEHASIVISSRNRSVAATIDDDGRGFDVGDVRAGALGLLGMRERLALVGGTLAVESSPESGTTIAAQVPLNATAAGASRPAN